MQKISVTYACGKGSLEVINNREEGTVYIKNYDSEEGVIYKSELEDVIEALQDILEARKKEDKK